MPESLATRAPRRLIALGVAALLAAAPFACGDLGEAAFEGDDGSILAPSPTSTSTAPIDASEDNAPPKVTLRGQVVGPANALVAIEVGGLDQVPPPAEGQVGTPLDLFYAYGTSLEDGGHFSVDVPDEKVGVHVYANGFFCGVSDGAVLPTAKGLTISPRPLTRDEAGALPLEPTIVDFTATPPVVMPGQPLTLAATVAAADPDSDPLSAQVVAIEPTSGWAGVFAPPKPGIWGKGYPNGIYGRLVIAPTTPGEYVYYLVAATEACVVSKPAAVHVLVSLTGEGGLEDVDAGDAGDESDASDAADASDASKDGAPD
jgi:hypothetical protein